MIKVIEEPSLKSFSGKFGINSICTVATKEVKREAHLLALCLSRFYQVPFIIYCDRDTDRYITKLNLPNVVTYQVSFQQPKGVKKHNTYHKTGAIAVKMDVISHCVNAFGNTIFLDVDIVPLHPFNGPTDCEVALSLNLSEISHPLSAINADGIFNAGMLWTCNKDFGDWWKEQYLTNKDHFYEQTSLNVVPNLYRTGYFPYEHNYGFWRGPLGNRIISSVHCHMDTVLDCRMNDWVKPRVIKLRTESLRYIFDRCKNVGEFYKEVFKK